MNKICVNRDFCPLYFLCVLKDLPCLVSSLVSSHLRYSWLSFLHPSLIHVQCLLIWDTTYLWYFNSPCTLISLSSHPGYETELLWCKLYIDILDIVVKFTNSFTILTCNRFFLLASVNMLRWSLLWFWVGKFAVLSDLPIIIVQ